MTAPGGSACILCGAPPGERIEKKDAKDGAPLPLTLCTGCGMLQLAEVPDEAALRAFYAEQYRKDYRKADRPKPKHVFRAGENAARRLEMLRPYLKPGMSLLDVGCGGGEFVYMARLRGIEAEGIDPAGGYLDFAREAYEIPLAKQELSELPAERRFDAISMFHVLEHLPSPTRALAELHGRLNPGGHLVIEVPDLAARRTSPTNQFFKAHIGYFSQFTMAILAQELFETELLRSGEVLFCVLRRRESPAAPADDDFRARSVDYTRQRLAERGMAEYLRHGGAVKFLVTLGRMRAERAGSQGKEPRQILDAIAAR